MKLSKAQVSGFQKSILEFYDKNSGSKPWNQDRDPYKIWLFEVIMQQTRMAQGIPYYERIEETYPTLDKLANAPEDELLSLWKGLGYYSRARNLQHTAKYIVYQLGGKFPNTYIDLFKLKGVGEYTAAAIASFAFKEDVAVLDGNVHRVLSRIFGIYKTIQSVKDKRYFQDIANQLLLKGRSDSFNQAIMDLGSTICTPQNPLCSDCFMSIFCYAIQNGKISDLPPKKKKVELKKRYFYQVFVISNNRIYLKKRESNDIWKGLFEGILQEGEIMDRYFWQNKGVDIDSIVFSDWNTQVLSHQKIYMKLGVIELPNWSNTEKMTKFNLCGLDRVALPRIVSKWWESRIDG